MSAATEVKSTVVFVGSPNSGKTTLFNWFTGSRFKTVNYPGATVDYSVGQPLPVYDVKFDVIDTPGIYSLSPKTLEEEVTNRVLFGTTLKNERKLVVVVDATQFTRQILLVDQLRSCGFHVVVALTMVDVLKSKGYSVNVERLAELVDAPVIPIDGRLGGNVDLLAQTLKAETFKPATETYSSWATEDYADKFKEFDRIKDEVIVSFEQKSLPKDFNQSAIQVWDRWLLHPVLGIFIFFAIMFAVFASVFWMASPAIDFVDSVFSGMAESVVALAPENLFFQFLGDGLIAGVGSFAVFVPQIAILFFGLGLLEDTGYLARASTLIDKPLAKVGLNGRSFVPILSSFACAVPGMMAARTIPNKKERLLTLFILPLMTCSARLPVYALLLSFVFAGESAFVAGGAMALIYFSSLLLGALVAVIANRFLPNEAQSFFMLELPAYRRPIFRKLFKTVFDKTIAFVRRAGPIILVLSLVIWVGSTFPNHNEPDEFKRFSTSYASQLGQKIEPLFTPMGADWRVGLGLMTSFAAREVFVSTLAVVFNVSGDSDEATESSLLEKMKTATHSSSSGVEGELIFTPASVLAIIVFFMIALQCMATVGVAKSEFGSWRLALTQLFVFNILAYILAVVAYQAVHFLA